MAFQEKEMNADGYLKQLLDKKSVLGYIVFNKDGIAMRYAGKNLTHKKAVHYAALMTDYWAIVKKMINKTLKNVLNKNESLFDKNNNDPEMEYIRFRTKKSTELILTCYNEYFLVCIQKCGDFSETETKVEKKEGASEEDIQDDGY